MSLGISSFPYSFSDALPVFLKYFPTPGQGAQDLLWASDPRVINNIGLDTCLVICHRSGYTGSDSGMEFSVQDVFKECSWN